MARINFQSTGGAFPSQAFCLLIKIYWGNPYLKILDLANLFVADSPMKKINKFSFTPSQSTLKNRSKNRPCLRGLNTDIMSKGNINIFFTFFHWQKMYFWHELFYSLSIFWYAEVKTSSVLSLVLISRGSGPYSCKGLINVLRHLIPTWRIRIRLSRKTA